MGWYDSPNSFGLYSWGGEPCTVTFEPSGIEYVLRGEDVLTVQTDALTWGAVEVAHAPSGIFVFVRDLAAVVVQNRAGEVIDVSLS